MLNSLEWFFVEPLNLTKKIVFYFPFYIQPTYESEDF